MAKNVKIPGIYVSPEVKVIETQAQTVICQSIPMGTDPYNRETW